MKVGDYAGKQREPIVHDPVTGHGKDRCGSWCAEADHNSDQRHFDRSQTAGVRGIALATFAAAYATAVSR
jgi:hypothetical protein